MKNKKIIIVVLVILTFLLVFFGFSYLKGSFKSMDNVNNYYRVSEKSGELAGTNVVENDDLSSRHCLEDICVENAVIYDSGIDGRVEYTIINNTSSEATGILKMNFGNDYVLVSYAALQAGDSINTSSQFHNLNLGDVIDYKLEKLTDEEKENLVIH